MKLHRVDKLAAIVLDHHLVATQIRSRQQLEAVRYAVQLQAVVLPNVQDASGIGRAGIDHRDSFEDRIAGFGDPNKPILILLRTIVSLLVLLEPIESNHAGAKTQTDELVPATDGQYGNRCRANKGGKAIENRLFVEVEISE